MSEQLSPELAKEVQEIATNAVASYIKDAGLDKIDQKHVIIPGTDAGISEKEQLALTQKERFGRLAKALVRKDYVTVNAVANEIKSADPNNMTTNGDGGYLVPDVTAAEILRLISTYGQARSLVNVGNFPKSIDNLTIPKESTGMTVYYPGEQGSITSSKPALTYLTLACKKAAALAVMTNELAEFASVDFANYIQYLAAKAFATDEDSKVFGTGASVFTGLFYASNSFGKTSEVSAYNAITYEDIMELIYGLDPAKLVGANWLMHRTVMEQLRLIKDQQDRPLFVDANAGGLPTFVGYPVRLAENAPSASSQSAASAVLALLGNFQNSFLKDKSGMRIDLSTEAYVDSSSLFQYDLMALRFIRHWTFHPGNVENYGALAIAAA